ncbi:hypothetical protein ACJIZ3_011209 [Penstemon smallii]|uniref:Uncharacterized protein n=1 Tax=Penstemon smallii TaxID=265156 RepID=A0ABD3R251_9LAMI
MPIYHNKDSFSMVESRILMPLSINSFSMIESRILLSLSIKSCIAIF